MRTKVDGLVMDTQRRHGKRGVEEGGGRGVRTCKLVPDEVVL